MRETMTRDLKDTQAKLSTMQSNADKDTDGVTQQLRSQVKKLEKDVSALQQSCRKLKSDNSVSSCIVVLACEFFDGLSHQGGFLLDQISILCGIRFPARQSPQLNVYAKNATPKEASFYQVFGDRAENREKVGSGSSLG